MNELEELARALAGASAVERENVTRDLRAVLLRLRTGEYTRTDFFARSTFDVPRRTREFMIYMNGWAQHARAWAEVLRAIGVERVSTIQDLCPGWAPKIEIALAQLGFRGEVVLVDRDRESSERIVEFMRIFEPRYRIVVRAEDVFAPGAPRAELVTANHIIDDLLFDRFGLQPYEDEAALVRAFAVLAASRSAALELAPSIAAALAARGERIAIAQYPSYIESLIDAGEGATVPLEVFARVVDELRQLGFVETLKNTTTVCLERPQLCGLIER